MADLLSRLPQHLVAVVPPADDEEVGPGRYRRGLKVGEPVRPITESRDEGDLATAWVRLCAFERVPGGSAHHVQADAFERVGDVVEEIDNFREIFEYSLDAELEDELNATAEEEN